MAEDRDEPRRHSELASAGDAGPSKGPANRAGGEAGGEAEEEGLEGGWENWVLPYIHDSALWPVLIVIVAHVVAGMIPLLISAVRERWIPAIVLTAWLGFLSYKLCRNDVKQHAGLSAIGWLLIITWLLGGTAAYFSDRTGLF
ncbi:MAG: hypothetical protein JRH16_12835 [Deltaproteobacteria bacterium]|nr:hypothetical protein [Deltaproteobacteria bacterium]MBW2361006.1 hypothetical protein [Deltaproteobacteria bacterium]